jgi:hypothetical protein
MMFSLGSTILEMQRILQVMLAKKRRSNNCDIYFEKVQLELHFENHMRFGA